MEDNLGINIFKFVVANADNSINLKFAHWLLKPSGFLPPKGTMYQVWYKLGTTAIVWGHEVSGALVMTPLYLPINLEVLEGKIMNETLAIPQELQEIMNELHAKLEIAGEGLDLFHALKKVHKHIHENPENLLFLKDEQVAEIVRACEITQDLTIKTTTKKASKPKASNDLILADNSLDFGDTSGMSLKELMASKKK